MKKTILFSLLLVIVSANLSFSAFPLLPDETPVLRAHQKSLENEKVLSDNVSTLLLHTFVDFNSVHNAFLASYTISLQSCSSYIQNNASQLKGIDYVNKTI